MHDREWAALQRATAKLRAAQPPKPKEEPKEPRKYDSGARGVTYDKANKRWRAFGPYRGGKQQYIGSYATKEAAIKGRERWMEKQIGI